ncbi:hypothetical protein ACQW02_08155 [Humitalea sp. 24SJ18S-53]|uniref:hypothetical protein n=1 Tax=Humitalea sp. 24SJ18S-53 TaxID=3422307 RepID=UPI003D679A3E
MSEILPPPHPATPKLAWVVLGLALSQPVVALLPVIGIGHPVGAMSAASLTAVTPASYAFTIWTPIFVLSLIWAIRQAMPSMAQDPVTMRLRPPLALAFAMNSLWMLVAQFSSNGIHLVLILAVGVGAAFWAFVPEARRLPDGGFSRWVLRPFLGLFAGWVTAAVFVNLAGAFKVAGVDPDPWLSAIIILLIGAVAALMLRTGRGDPWYLLAAGWGLTAVLLANLGLAAVGAPATAGFAPALRFELVPAIAATLALVGVVAVGFGIWRKGGMTA